MLKDTQWARAAIALKTTKVTTATSVAVLAIAKMVTDTFTTIVITEWVQEGASSAFHSNLSKTVASRTVIRAFNANRLVTEFATTSGMIPNVGS